MRVTALLQFFKSPGLVMLNRSAAEHDRWGIFIPTMSNSGRQEESDPREKHGVDVK